MSENYLKTPEISEKNNLGEYEEKNRTNLQIASPIHLANITATIVGTMNSRLPVNSNIITTSDTVILKYFRKISQEKRKKNFKNLKEIEPTW